MLWSDIAQLISYNREKDDIGDTIKTPIYRDVYVNKKSIRQNEYYQALSTGLKPELMITVRSIDYKGEKKISFKEKKYNIIRTYETNGEITELICEAVV